MYETLRRKVLTLELPPGAALSENELAAALGVSRTPVRESLILLAEEGLVQVFPQVGSFVSRVDPDRVADAQFLREAVELAALDDMPAELDPDVVAELRENLDRQQAPGIDLEEFFALDEAFHHGLLRLSGHAQGLVHGGGGEGPPRPRPPPRTEGEPHRPRSPTSTSRSSTRSSTGDLAARPRHHAHAPAGRLRRHRAASASRSPELFATDDGSVPVRRNVVVWE